MKKSEYTDIMIDVESLGNEGKFVVTQVALVPFNINKELNFESIKKDSFVEGISIKDSKKYGFEIDINTLKWWIDTDVEKLLSHFDYTKTINEVCFEMRSYLSQFLNIKRFWATATLDYQAISNIFKAVSIKNPISYDKRFCARTIRMIASTYGYKYENINSHDASDDCSIQIMALKQQLKISNINLE